MTSDLFPVFAYLTPTQLTPTQNMILAAMAIAIGPPMLVSIVAIVAWAWTKVNRLRIEKALKQQMIDRGMPTEEILAVLNHRGWGKGAVESPCASEVVVNVDGDWQMALVLRREGERYYVHVVGTEMSENRWVSGDRVRFPAGGTNPFGSPWDWSFAAGGFRDHAWCHRGGHAKPAPVDQEI